MIERLDPIKHTDNLYDRNGFITNVACGGVVVSKVNELVDAINKLKTMAKNTNTVLKSLVEENNIHERQIDELQMKLEPHKCEPAENGKSSKTEQSPYEKQRKWIGKLCRFWDSVYDRYYFDTLKGITDEGLFIGHNGVWKHCEPVKADSDIIYKGGDNDSPAN